MAQRFSSQPARRLYPLVRIAHQRVAAHLFPGAWAVDATAGRGHDTLFLARAVGPEGHVFAVDISQEALAATRARLLDAGVSERVSLQRGDHAALEHLLPAGADGRISAVMFNLGYLPGSGKSTPTRTRSTLPALGAARRCLRSGGVMTVLCYTGHPEGAGETAAVEAWSASQTADLAISWHCSPAERADAPRLLVALRK